MNSRKIILAKNPKLANSRNSRKFLPKISRIFQLAKVSSAKVSSFNQCIISAMTAATSLVQLQYILQNIIAVHMKKKKKTSMHDSSPVKYHKVHLCQED